MTSEFSSSEIRLDLDETEKRMYSLVWGYIGATLIATMMLFMSNHISVYF